MPRYRPGEVAKRLGVSPSTVRAWSEAYKDALSPGARPTRNEAGNA